MNQEIIEIIAYSGGASISLYFIYKIIECILLFVTNKQLRRDTGSNNFEDRLKKLEKNGLEKRISKVEENDIVHIDANLKSINLKIDKIEERLRVVENKITTVETKIKYIIK